MKLELPTNATVVDDAMRLVTERATKTLTSKTDHLVVSVRQQQEGEAEEKITTNQVF